MKPQTLDKDKLETERLFLMPFTIEIAQDILNGNFENLYKLGLQKGKSWPDIDVVETLPKIIVNLSKVAAPTGFESWMVIKSDSSEIIGDVGFKGLNSEEKSIDIGYGIIKEERRKGYAEEAIKELLKWAFSTHLVNEITAKCLLGNHSSINLLQKLDFEEVRRDQDMIYWILQRF